MSISYSLYDLHELSQTAGAPSPTPTYCPPDICFVGSGTVMVPQGNYHKCGHRVFSQFQDLEGGGSVTLDAPAYVNVNSYYVGNRVNSCFYSMFMVGNDTDYQLLPYVRVQSIDYDTTVLGHTTIVLGNHDDDPSSVSSASYIDTDDVFNGYRVVKYSGDVRGLTNGNDYTVVDTDATSGYITIAGDYTAELSVGAGLQLIPPSSTKSLYLGTLRIQSDGSVAPFLKNGWCYRYIGHHITVNGSRGTIANSWLGSAIPPNARVMTLYDINSTSSQTDYYRASAHMTYYRTGNSGANELSRLRVQKQEQSWQQRHGHPNILPITYTQYIRNGFYHHYYGTWRTPQHGYMFITGWYE